MTSWRKAILIGSGRSRMTSFSTVISTTSSRILKFWALSWKTNRSERPSRSLSCSSGVCACVHVYCGAGTWNKELFWKNVQTTLLVCFAAVLRTGGIWTVMAGSADASWVSWKIKRRHGDESYVGFRGFAPATFPPVMQSRVLLAERMGFIASFGCSFRHLTGDVTRWPLKSSVMSTSELRAQG